MPFDHILLEDEQKDLFKLMVEASRSLPRDQRVKFLLSKHMGGATLIHKGLRQRMKVYDGDLDTLAGTGVLAVTYGSQGSPLYDVTPLGLKYYDYLKKEQGQPTETVEQDVRLYLDAAGFRERQPEAYDKWVEAERCLWSSDSTKELTTIGHLCREAVQEFLDKLIESLKIAQADPDKAHVVARARKILDHVASSTGKTERALADALLVYWGTLIDLVQRQEHGGQKEGEALAWEDGRRVVFQSLVVMYEFDRLITRSG